MGSWLTVMLAAQPDAGLYEARRAFDAAYFPEAVASAEAALRTGTLVGDELIEAQLLLGEAKASMDQRGPAAGHFSVACALNPQVRLGEETSPKLRAIFEQACGEPRQVQATIHWKHQEGSSFELTVSVVDALLIVESVMLVAGSQKQRLPGRPAVGSFSCTSSSSEVTIDLLDAFGNVLKRLPVDTTGMLASMPTAPSVPPASAPPTKQWYQRPWPYLTVGAAVFTIFGISFGLQLRDEQAHLVQIQAARREYFFSDAQAVHTSSVRHRGAMLASFSLAALALAGALITWLVSP